MKTRLNLNLEFFIQIVVQSSSKKSPDGTSTPDDNKGVYKRSICPHSLIYFHTWPIKISLFEKENVNNNFVLTVLIKDAKCFENYGTITRPIFCT